LIGGVRILNSFALEKADKLSPLVRAMRHLEIEVLIKTFDC